MTTKLTPYESYLQQALMGPMPSDGIAVRACIEIPHMNLELSGWLTYRKSKKRCWLQLPGHTDRNPNEINFALKDISSLKITRYSPGLTITLKP